MFYDQLRENLHKISLFCNFDFVFIGTEDAFNLLILWKIVQKTFLLSTYRITLYVVP